MKKIKKTKKVATKKPVQVQKAEEFIMSDGVKTVALEDIMKWGVLDAHTVLVRVLNDLSKNKKLNEKIASQFIVEMYKEYELE
jgi:hypothetical protein